LFIKGFLIKGEENMNEQVMVISVQAQETIEEIQKYIRLVFYSTSAPLGSCVVRFCVGDKVFFVSKRTRNKLVDRFITDVTSKEILANAQNIQITCCKREAALI